MSTPPLGAAELIARARALVPRWAERALEAERARRPDDASIAELEASGLLALLVPRALGGHESDVGTLCDVVATLGEGCTSTAWVTAFYIVHSWIAALFPEPAQAEFFAEHPWVRAPAALAPTGQAQAEGEAFRLSGRWQWGTGVAHADWVFVSGAVVAADGAPTARMFALPVGDVRVDDVWFTDGMRATASNDIVVENVLVPGYRSVDMRALAASAAPGSALHTNVLYRLPFTPFLALIASLPALGTARAAVEVFRNRLRERLVYLSTTKQQDKPAAQMRLARADQDVRTADGLIRSLATDLVGQASASARVPIVARARMRMTAMTAVHLCRDAARALCDGGGASAHFDHNPLQRAVRDLTMLACHTIFDSDATAELYGRVLLGMEPGTLLV